MVIAIEGLAGVGKTTLAESLAKELGFEYVKFPLGNLMGLDSENGRNALINIVKHNNKFITAWFLALNDICVIEKYRDKDIVVDRFLLTNYFWNHDESTDDVFKLCFSSVKKPDIVILLTASKETRIKRLQGRNPNDMNLTHEGSLNADDSKFITLLHELKCKHEIIDVNSMDKAEVLEYVMSIIKNHRPKA